jgi:hypothetical protein
MGFIDSFISYDSHTFTYFHVDDFTVTFFNVNYRNVLGLAFAIISVINEYLETSRALVIFYGTDNESR